MRTAIKMITAAMLTAAGPALATETAAPTLATETAAPVRAFTGRLTLAAPTQTRGVKLVAGRNYALTGGSGGWCTNYTVRRPDGKVVARTGVDADPDPEDLHTAEFLAPVTGTYRLTAKGDPCWTEFRWAYYFADIYRDCPGSVRSPCRVAPGKSWTGRHLTYDDVDWIGVSLLVGQSYSFTSATYGHLVLYDPSGAVAASTEGSTDKPAAIRNFVPQRGGTWFISDEDSVGAFKIAVSQP